jgi:phosphopantetheinyl transferase
MIKKRDCFVKGDCVLYIGLSCVSQRKAENATLHNEGRRVLRLLDGRSDFRAGKPDIAVEAGGRPFFTDYHADFNISHSCGMVAVTYSAKKSAAAGLPFRTGCDIQHIRHIENLEKIAQRAFSHSEQDYIATASHSAERTDRFYQIWVLKECYLKAFGLSIFNMGKVPSFAVSGGLAKTVSVPAAWSRLACLTADLYELGDDPTQRYMLATAWESMDGDTAFQSELCWFSEAPAMRRFRCNATHQF